LNEKGCEEYLAGNYKVAIFYYTEAIKEDTLNPINYFFRSKARFMINDYQGVVRDCDKVIRIDSNLDNEIMHVYYYSGRAKLELNDYQGSYEDFSKLIAFNPNDTIVYYYRSQSLDKLNRYSEALKDINLYISLIPDISNHPYVLIHRGEIYEDLKDYKSAFADYNSVINEYSHGVFLSRGAMKEKLHDSIGALSDYTITIELDSSNDVAYYYRGVLNYFLKRYKEALHDLSKTIEINSSYCNAYFYRANVKLILKDTYGACQDWQKGLELCQDSTAMNLMSTYCKSFKDK
jgi:tetratricopeptide (TPR) repeat protein